MNYHTNEYRNFQIISGLHIQKYYPRVPDFKNFINVCSDTLILAGDIGRLEFHQQYFYFLASLAREFKKIYLVPGCNEFFSEKYNYSYLRNILSGFEQKIPNLVVLSERWVDIENTNIRLYGTTLWDYIDDSRKGEKIHIRQSGISQRDLINQEHERCIQSLEYMINTTELENSNSDIKKKIIIVSYSPPISFESHVENNYSQNNYVTYRNKLYRFFSVYIDTWIYGFTHINRDFFIKFEYAKLFNFRCISNCFLDRSKNADKTIKVFFVFYLIDELFSTFNPPILDLSHNLFFRDELDKNCFHPLKI